MLKMMMPSLATSRLALPLVAVLVALPPGLRAQQADDDVFELSPFRVDASGDSGYLATNSTSGTRLNVEIKDLPMPLEVINSEFLQDTGATDFKEAIAYSAGAFAFETNSGTGTGANSATTRDRSPSASASVGNFRNNAISIRGFNVPFQQRNGFRIGGFIPTWGVNLGGITDAVSMERIEVVRGPQALLYGISVLSGIANIIPKYPLSEQRQEVTFAVGSDDYYRGTLDVTGPTLVDNLNYRAFAALQEEGNWTDFRDESKTYAGLQLEYRPVDWIRLFTDFQYADTRVEGISTQFVRDTINAFTNDDELRNEFGEYIDWARDPAYGDRPDSFRWSGPDTYYEREEWNWLLDLEIEPLENLVFKSGLLMGEQEIEEFQVRMNTVTNEEGSLKLRQAMRSGAIDPSIVHEFVNPEAPGATGQYPEEWDYRTMRYWWVKDPTTAENLQLRNELTYQLETPFLFDTTARHNFLLGRQDIEDVIDFTNRSESFSDVYWFQRDFSRQPYQVRDLYDYSPLRYNGEILAQPGDDYFQTKLWFTGHYFVYNGRFFNEKLNLIAGLRHDRYNVWEGIYERDDWRNPDADPTDPSTFIDPNYNPTDPNQLGGFRETRHLFAEAQTGTTNTLAASYAVNDAVNVYAMYAEGLSPNTGQVDGMDDPIPAESTTSREIGIKFELWDRKLSGTIAFYQIKRENATWDYIFAPNPKIWANGTDTIRTGEDPATSFSPSRVESGAEPISYGIHASYFDELGISYDKIVDREAQVVRFPDGILGVATSAFTDDAWVYVDYASLDETGLRQVMEAAFNDVVNLEDFTPIDYSRRRDGYGNNPSNRANIQGGGKSTFVTFTDEAEGMDLQMIYSPISNWQFIFNYAYTTREALTPFNFVPAADQETGVNYGTEYDLWVYFMGRENFEDPTDPTSLNSGGIKGISLYFGPEHSASFWTKYTFLEGRLENLGLAGGVIYTGESPTSIPIGDRDLASNPFRTPETADRYRVDLSLSYRWYKGPYEWRLGLNVYNVLDDTGNTTFATYPNPETDRTETRRTQQNFAPRSYRLSLSLKF